MFLNRKSVGIATNDGIGIFYLLMQIMVLWSDDKIVCLSGISDFVYEFSNI